MSSTRVSGLRRLAEVLPVSALGGFVLWAGLTNATLGALVGLGYAILMTPALVERWRAPILGFFPGFMACMWVVHTPLSKFGWFVAVLLPVILTYHYVIQAIGAALLRRYTALPAVVILPIAVGAGEWIRPYLAVGSFNMYGVGSFLASQPILIQAAELVGALGLSVLWTIPFAFGVDLLKRVLDGAEVVSRRTLVAGGAASLFVLAFLVAFGLARMDGLEWQTGPRIAVVQPSEDHGWDITHEVVRITRRMTVEHVAPGSADVIVWPENAILAVYDEEPEYRETVNWLASTREAHMLVGTQGLAPDGERPTNTSVLVSPEGEVIDHYDKVVLFPFTERRAFPWLHERVPWLAAQLDAIVRAAWGVAPDGWAPERALVMHLPWEGTSEPIPFWTAICYEAGYPDLGRDVGRQGARFFANLTSEGWLGWAVSNNQMAVNILRAVEHRVGNVRVGNTGPSAFILPNGKIDRYLRGFTTGRLRLEAGVLTHTIALGSGEPTIYARIGDVLDPAWIVIFFVLLGVGIVRSRARRPPKSQATPGPTTPPDGSHPDGGGTATRDTSPFGEAP